MIRLISILVVALATRGALAQDHSLDADPAPVVLNVAGEDDHGAEGHGKAGVMDFSLAQFISTLLAFGLVFFILYRLAWPKILGGLEEREQKIRSEVFAAEAAHQKAAESLKEYEQSLAKAKAEATEMIEKTKAEQTRMAAELRTKAEAELNQMRESARQNIDAAKRAALTEIYNEAASLATEVASKILQREVNEDDQRRLVEESVDGFTKEYAAS